MAAGYDGSIRIDTKVDTTSFNRGTKTISSGLSSLTGTLKKFALAVGVAFSVKKIIDFGRSAISAATELENALMGLRSVMEGQGRSFVQAQKFVNDYVSDGLVPATQAITAYKNLALRGYDDSQIKQVMVALKDAAAFGRQASYSLGEAVVSATEGLKNENSILVDNAGVTKNVAKMWEDYAKSIGTTANNLTQQQKIQAEVNGILEETRFQTGDAAKIAGSYSGSVLQMSFAFNNLKVAVGNVFMPVLQKVIPHIINIINLFTRLANLAAQVSAALFGKVVNVNTQVAESGSGAAAALDSVASAEEKAGDAAEKAGKQAKGALASFDELNVLSQNAGGADNTEIAVPEVGGTTATVETVTDTEVNPKLLEGIGRLKELLAPAARAAARLWEELKRLGGFAWEGLADFYNSFLVPVGRWVLGEGLPRFIDIVTEGLSRVDWQKINDALNRLWEALAPFAIKIGEGLLWLFENVLMPIGVWAASTALPVVIEAIAAGFELLNGVLDVLAPIGRSFFETFLKPLGEWTGGAVTWALEVLVQRLESVAEWVKDNAVIVQGVTVAIGAFAAAWNIASAAVKLFGGASLALVSPIGAVVLAITGIITAITLLVTHWDTVKAKAVEVWEGIKEAWGGAVGWLKENLLDPFENRIKSTANFFIGMINGMISGVEGFVNFFIDGINDIINGLNKISFSIPSWVPKIGGQSWGFNLDNVPPITLGRVPALATGAVLPANQPFLAMLGDQKSGRNLEAPEGLIRQIMREELEGMGRNDVTIRFGGDMAQLVRLLKPYIDKENSRAGVSLVTGGVY